MSSLFSWSCEFSPCSSFCAVSVSFISFLLCFGPPFARLQCCLPFSSGLLPSVGVVGPVVCVAFVLGGTCACVLVGGGALFFLMGGAVCGGIFGGVCGNPVF